MADEPQDNQTDEIEYDCGCQVSKDAEGTWIVTYFCETHDPTIKHGG